MQLEMQPQIDTADAAQMSFWRAVLEQARTHFRKKLDSD